MNITGLKKQIDALRKRKSELKKDRHNYSNKGKIKKIDRWIEARRWKIKKLREQKPKKKKKR